MIPLRTHHNVDVDEYRSVLEGWLARVKHEHGDALSGECFNVQHARSEVCGEHMSVTVTCTAADVPRYVLTLEVALVPSSNGTKH